MAKGETVDRILAQVRAAAPDLPDGTLEKIARGIHADLGGGKHYIAKNPSWGKAWRLGDAIAAGVPFAQAYLTMGFSQRSAYRAVGRKRKAA